MFYLKFFTGAIILSTLYVSAFELSRNVLLLSFYGYEFIFEPFRYSWSIVELFYPENCDETTMMIIFWVGNILCFPLLATTSLFVVIDVRKAVIALRAKAALKRVEEAKGLERR